MAIFFTGRPRPSGRKRPQSSKFASLKLKHVVPLFKASAATNELTRANALKQFQFLRFPSLRTFSQNGQNGLAKGF